MVGSAYLQTPRVGGMGSWFDSIHSIRCSTIDLGHFTVVLANFIATFRLYSDNLQALSEYNRNVAIKFAKTTVKCPRSIVEHRIRITR